MPNAESVILEAWTRPWKRFTARGANGNWELGRHTRAKGCRANKARDELAPARSMQVRCLEQSHTWPSFRTAPTRRYQKYGTEANANIHEQKLSYQKVPKSRQSLRRVRCPRFAVFMYNFIPISNLSIIAYPSIYGTDMKRQRKYNILVLLDPVPCCKLFHVVVEIVVVVVEVVMCSRFPAYCIANVPIYCVLYVF